MIQLFGGIFQDEKCIQLVILLCEYATLLFQDLYNRCKERFHEHKDMQEKFIKCMQMADDWTDATVVKELRRLAVLNPECENMFQYAFANYVRQKYKEIQKTTAPMHITLTMPEHRVFFTFVIKEFVSNAYMQSGRFFQTDTDGLVKKDCVMDCIRRAFHRLEANHVVVHARKAVNVAALSRRAREETNGVENDENGENNKNDDIDDIDPSDSVSNAGAGERWRARSRLSGEIGETGGPRSGSSSSSRAVQNDASRLGFGSGGPPDDTATDTTYMSSRRSVESVTNESKVDIKCVDSRSRIGSGTGTGAGTGAKTANGAGAEDTKPHAVPTDARSDAVRTVRSASRSAARDKMSSASTTKSHKVAAFEFPRPQQQTSR